MSETEQRHDGWIKARNFISSEWNRANAEGRTKDIPNLKLAWQICEVHSLRLAAEVIAEINEKAGKQQ